MNTKINKIHEDGTIEYADSYINDLTLQENAALYLAFLNGEKMVWVYPERYKMYQEQIETTKHGLAMFEFGGCVYMALPMKN